MSESKEKSLSPTRQAALEKLAKFGYVRWSATSYREAAAFNWLVKNGFAESVNGSYVRINSGDEL